ncbi:MAG: glycoside hydrolase domain-containing protein [bacterium]
MPILNKQLGCSAIFIILLFSSFCYSAGYDQYGPVPLVGIGKTNHPPILDGKLDEWSQAVSVSGFTLNNGKGYASQPTRVYLTYDDNTLYLAFHCEEKEIAKLQTTEIRHDGLVWEDDSIEIILNPDADTALDWKHNIHLIINAAGTVYDAKGIDPENAEWNSDATVAVGREENAFIIEVGIPLSKITAQPDCSHPWQLNFYRNRIVGQSEQSAWSYTPGPWKYNFQRHRILVSPEYSSWSFCPGPLKYPIRLGILSFLDSVPQILLPDRINLGLGYNEFDYQLINTQSDKTFHLQIEGMTRFDNNPIADIVLSPKETIKKKLAFPIEGFEDGVQLTLLDDKKQTVYRTVYPLFLEPESAVDNLLLQSVLLREVLKNPYIPKNIATGMNATLQEGVTVYQELKQKSETAFQKQQQVSQADWVSLSKRIDTVYQKINNAQTIVWTKGIWENIVPTEMPNAIEDTKEINLMAMQDEYVSAAVNITNFTNFPYTARVSLALATSSSAQSGSVSFLRDNIVFHQAIYRPLRNGQISGDALPALDAAQLFTLQPVQTGQIWISIKTHGVPAGEYFGEMTIIPLSPELPQKTILLQINVLPISLPKVAPISTYTWDYTHSDEYFQDLTDHKINVLLLSCNICLPECDTTGNVIKLDFTELDEAIAIRHKYGNQLMFSYGVVRDFDRLIAKKYHWEYLSDPWKKAFASWLTQWINHLQQLGLDYTDFAMQIWDEATGKEVQKVVEAGPFLRSIDPRLRWVMDGAQDSDEVNRMAPYVDVWIPHLDSLLQSTEKDRLVALLKSTGKPVWCYTCRINMIEQPVLDYYRLKPWYAYQLGFNGVCFWAYNSWRGDPWNDFDATNIDRFSDNGVIYSGDHGPITSRRWEAFRAGIQDYQYLDMLQQLIKLAKEESTVQGNDNLAKLAIEANGVLNEAVNQVLTKKDETTLNLWRQKIAEMILKLKNQSEVRSQ